MGVILGNLGKSWQKVLIWAVVLGLIATLIADFGEWERFPVNLLWRVLITAIGGVLGVVLDYFGSFYVSMGANVIESMNITSFSDDKHQKILNSFIFVMSLVAAILAMIFIQ
ncbi:MAG TPA: hypothetical protein VF952_06115 [Chloroflexia bacterium]|jgi:hypothetical protein